MSYTPPLSKSHLDMSKSKRFICYECNDFSKELLDDNTLIMLSRVKIKSLYIIPLSWEGLMYAIDFSLIIHFHYHLFEDLLLFPSLEQKLPKLFAVQDWVHHEHQFAMLYLSTMILSVLYFNTCNVKTSNIRNVNISATNKSAIFPLLWYSSWFLVDHLVSIPCKDTLVNMVKFVMYKKLWHRHLDLGQKMRAGV